MLRHPHSQCNLNSSNAVFRCLHYNRQQCLSFNLFQITLSYKYTTEKVQFSYVEEKRIALNSAAREPFVLVNRVTL